MAFIVALLCSVTSADAMQASSSNFQRGNASLSFGLPVAVGAAAAAAAGAAALCVTGSEAPANYSRVLARKGERPQPQPPAPSQSRSAVSSATSVTEPIMNSNHGPLNEQVASSQTAPKSSVSSNPASRLASLHRRSQGPPPSLQQNQPTLPVSQAELDLRRSKHEDETKRLKAQITQLEERLRLVSSKLTVAEFEITSLHNRLEEESNARTSKKTGTSDSRIRQYRKDAFGCMSEPVKIAVISSELASMWKKSQASPENEETKVDESGGNCRIAKMRKRRLQEELLMPWVEGGENLSGFVQGRQRL
jgi:hypothetical protein